MRFRGQQGILRGAFFGSSTTSFAAIIAERERQATLTILRNLSDRELWDIGLARSQIGAGLAEAAKERARLQKSLAERSGIKR
jgi:uncharacterized protein YjiS (DUF1127 family)